MIATLIGAGILVAPYILGVLLNFVFYGKKIELYESFGWTYVFGIVTIAIPLAFFVASYWLGLWVMGVFGL